MKYQDISLMSSLQGLNIAELTHPTSEHWHQKQKKQNPQKNQVKTDVGKNHDGLGECHK